MSMALAALLVLLLCTACHSEPAESGSTDSRPSGGAESVGDRSDGASEAGSAAESENNGESGDVTEDGSAVSVDGTTAVVPPGSSGGAVTPGSTAGNGGSVPAGTTACGGGTAGGKVTQATKSTTRTTAGTKETIPPRPDVDTDHLSLTPNEEEADYLCASTSKNAANENYRRINYCLQMFNRVYLEPGATFLIEKSISLIGDMELTSSSGNRPTLKLTRRCNEVVKVEGKNNRLSNLILNYNNMYYSASNPCQAVMTLSGQNNIVSRCDLLGGDKPQRKVAAADKGLSRMTGVFFLGAGSTGNTVQDCVLRNCYYGAIFQDVMTREKNTNTLLRCDILYNRADGITFPGYGIVRDSKIHHNGYDCLNGTPPIPGAGIYCQEAYKGALIEGNQIYANNGFNIDLNGGSGFVIKNNRIYDPGWRDYPEAEDYKHVTYSNGISVVLSNMSNCTVSGNTIENNLDISRSADMYAGDPNGYYHADGAKDFSDLPGGGNTVVAFVLANYHGYFKSYGNVIEDNTIKADPPSAKLTGIGLVVCRNSGYKDNAKTWTEKTANLIRNNDLSKCDVGSVRLGKNRYSGNTDDSKHTGDPLKNDGKYFF